MKIEINVCKSCWMTAQEEHLRALVRDEDYEGTAELRYRQRLEHNCVDEAALTAFGVAF